MKKTMIVMATLAMFTLSVNAQEQGQRRGNMSEEEMSKRLTEMVGRQAESLAKDMDLKDDAKTQFIATYTEYQEALMNVRLANRNSNEENAENAREGRNNRKEKDLTDEEATQRIQENFARQEEQIAQSQKTLEITREYYAKFQETLTPQQLYKVFGQQQRGGMNRQGGQQGGMQGGFPGGGGGDF